MKKKLLFTLSITLGLGVLYFNLNSETKADKQAKQHAKFLKEHPYNRTIYLSKKERKSLGLTPNAYFEQEYLNEINPSTGRTHPENIFALQEKIELERNQKRVPGDDANNSWVERGPNNVGGRTRVILFDPNDATYKRVFAGGVSGGLWVNNDITDANSSWQQIGISENLTVTCITVDPNNSQIMYVGTGESYASAGIGNGVWKTTDGGATWFNVFRDSFNPTLRDRIYYINDIKARNNNGNTEIFVGVAGASDGFSDFPGANSHGLYKSSDNGTNWTRLNLPAIPETTIGDSNSIYEPNDIEISSDNTIWVSTGSNIWGEGGGTILKSTNGTDFSIAYTISTANTRRTEIAISSQNPNKIYVLAEVSTSSSTGAIVAPFLSFFKTENAFETTSSMGLPSDADSGIPAEDFTRGQAFYDLVIETDPTNDAVLYVGGIDLFRSTNSGTFWKQMSKWSNNNALAQLNVPRVHADQHGLVFHPTDSNKAIISNDGGVYYAVSLSGATEDINPNNNIVARNKDYNTLQFYNGAIGQNTDADVLLAGAQDNGTPFIEQAANNSSNPSVDIYGGDGAYSFIDKDGEYMIASYVYNAKALFNLPYTGSGKELDDDQDTGNFINVQGLDDNLDILYANAHDAATSSYNVRRYKGIKEGETLVKEDISNLRLNSPVTAIKISPFETNSTTLYLGLQSGDLLKVTNADTATPTWTSIKAAFFRGSISSISFGKNENEILTSFHNYGVTSVWFTENGGSFWLRKEGDLPDIPVKAIMMNPLNNDQVIIGTELGVWTSSNFKDSSPKWIQANNGMSDVKVTSLELRTQDNTVLASTYGRGMFTGKFTAAVASVDEILFGSETFTIYPAVSNGNFTVLAKSDLGKTTMSVFDISGRQVHKAELDFNQKEKQSISINVNSGIYIVNLVDENGKKSSKKIVIE